MKVAELLGAKPIPRDIYTKAYAKGPNDEPYGKLHDRILSVKYKKSKNPTMKSK